MRLYECDIKGRDEVGNMPSTKTIVNSMSQIGDKQGKSSENTSKNSQQYEETPRELPHSQQVRNNPKKKGNKNNLQMVHCLKARTQEPVSLGVGRAFKASFSTVTTSLTIDIGVSFIGVITGLFRGCLGLF